MPRRRRDAPSKKPGKATEIKVTPTQKPAEKPKTALQRELEYYRKPFGHT